MEQNMTSAHWDVQQLEERRVGVSADVDRKYRSALGQFFTPYAVAKFMASLLKLPNSGEITLLDPGAGIGSLTAAAAQSAIKTRFKVTCYEIEPRFQAELRETLSSLPNVEAAIESGDFIERAVLMSVAGRKPGYDHVILNPPYKKINGESRHRMLVRKLGLETSNLYACFIACAVALCRDGAEIVAIVPRSFMNGQYFKPFRYWLLDRVALTHIHIFDSRDRAFSDDEVLQETVILRMEVGAKQGRIEVTACNDQSFTDLRHRVCAFSEIIEPGDAELYLHVPTLGSPHPTACRAILCRSWVWTCAQVQSLIFACVNTFAWSMKPAPCRSFIRPTSPVDASNGPAPDANQTPFFVIRRRKNG